MNICSYFGSDFYITDTLPPVVQWAAKIVVSKKFILVIASTAYVLPKMAQFPTAATVI